LKKIAKKLNIKDIKTITKRQLIEMDTRILSKITGQDEPSTNRLKLAIMGIPTKDKRPNHKITKGSGKITRKEPSKRQRSHSYHSMSQKSIRK
jgi:hypothetical protein